MKQKAIHAGILAVIFILAIVLFSYMTNRKEEDVTTEMGSASLPEISFQYENFEINNLKGYTNEMEISTMRDTITPVENGVINAKIDDVDKKATSVSYEIYSVDGRKKLYSGEAKIEKNTVELSIPEKVLSEGERFLKITLNMEGDKRAYYYTRIGNSADWNMQRCMAYVKNFFDKERDKTAAVELKKALEPSSEGDNSTYQTVTIHSDFDHVTWGNLEPKIVGDVKWEIKEANSYYMSVLLSYQTDCKGDDDQTERYNVNEYFRVRYSDNKQMYLLDYNRTMNQIFDGETAKLDKDGILLGVTDANVDYLVNKEGSVVSFVQERELWNYNKKENQLSRVFTYEDEKDKSGRNYDDHVVQLVSMDKDGSTTFTVSGYVNRGPHEGEVGVSVYFYDINKNSVEEKVFIPSVKSASVLTSDPGKLIYYSEGSGKLYMMQDGTLYEVDLIHDTRKTLVKNLHQGQYVSSEDGKLLAYQKKGELNNATQIEVLNLATGKGYLVEAGKEESIRPLGFIRNDFMYGTARQGDSGITASGQTVIPMYKLEIRNQRNETVKTYQVDQTYILDVVFEDDMATLKRAVKTGNSYNYIAEDYITNNEEREESNISVATYRTEQKGTQIRLEYADGITDKSPKLLQPKLVMAKGQMTLSFDASSKKGSYYVYGEGKLQGIYQNAGYAVKKAEELRGVVVTSRLAYVYESGNKPVSYEITDLGDTSVREGENRLEAGVRIIMQRENAKLDFEKREKNDESVIEFVNDNASGEILELSGCTTEQVLYLISRNTPVVALTGNGNAVLLTGYDKKTVTYFDLSTQSEKTVTQEKMNEMVKASGNTFVGYTK